MHSFLVAFAYMSMVLLPCAVAQWGNLFMREWWAERAAQQPKRLVIRSASLQEAVTAGFGAVAIEPAKMRRRVVAAATAVDPAERVAERLAALTEVHRAAQPEAVAKPTVSAPKHLEAEPKKVVVTRGVVPVAMKRVVSPGEAMAYARAEAEVRAKAEAQAKAEAAARARAEADARRRAAEQERAQRAAMLEAARIAEARRQAAAEAALLEQRRQREAEVARLAAEERSRMDAARMEAARMAAAAAAAREMAARQAQARPTAGPVEVPRVAAVAGLPMRVLKDVYAQYGFDDDDPPSGPPTESSGEMSVAA